MITKRDGLSVHDSLHDLIAETAKGLALDAKVLLGGFAAIVKELAPENRKLLQKRDRLQQQIDEYFTQRVGVAFDAKAYEKFLGEIGYIVPEGGDFQVATGNVDPEFTTPAPQLVCPVFIGENPQTNARYPLNAINARWGSLYDALYGKPGDTNVIAEDDGKGFTKGYNPGRGQAVIDYVNHFLDRVVPLSGASYGEVVSYELQENHVVASLENGRKVSLANPEHYVGFCRKGDALSSVMLKNNGLHIELQIDRTSQISGQNPSGVKDVVMEAALTAIIDLEDATAAVDAADKILAYRNLIGLMKGDLTAEVDNAVRKLEADRKYITAQGAEATLHGRSLILLRRTGMHMYTDAVTIDGKDIPEGYLDTLMIALASMYDLKKKKGELKNSATGSVYIVMPKMHGPEEVALTVTLFEKMEGLFGLPAHTLKIGIMDEEQRTSVNLKECIRAAKDRIVFINTGFLDRTGDLIHTSMQAGVLDTKAGMKDAPWLDAYEKNNVQVGLATGLHKAGQIGKGMWTQNKNPAGLVATKGAHPKAGATTAWVPDPKNAVLHAMHYHETNVKEVQQLLLGAGNHAIAKARILEIPFLTKALSPQDKDMLLYSYMQSIAGYVAPWVDEGVGCSSVPDHTGTYLMEDRATLRIGSQLVANWLKHKVITEEDLKKAAVRAAATVDEQNKQNPAYTPMSGNYNGPAFRAVMALIHEGTALPNGYVEPVLIAARKEVKNSA